MELAAQIAALDDMVAELVAEQSDLQARAFVLSGVRAHLAAELAERKAAHERAVSA